MVSVIVITHNRADQVAECVRRIAAMRADGIDHELIVILDACVDHTREILEGLRPMIPGRLVIDAIRAGNPAAARNRGAELASGNTLLFLDDDTEPSRDLLTSHLAGQRHSDVVVGYLKLYLNGDADWWRLGARLWWEDRFTAMREPGHTTCFRDLFTANVSIKSDLFGAVGGFDEKCLRLEDYELGIRLIKAGATISHNPAAWCLLHENGTVRQWLARARVEALSEIHIGQKHPEYRTSVFQDRLQGEDQRITDWKSRVREVAFRRRQAIDAATLAAGRALPLLESLSARQTWRHVMGGVHEYSYWRCIANHFGTESEFLSWVGES